MQYLAAHRIEQVDRHDRQIAQNYTTDTVLKKQIKSSAQTTSKMDFDNDRYGGGRAVSDALIAPAKFGGSTAEDAASFFRHVVRYFDYKGLSDKERIDIFSLLLKNSAADWFSTLDDEMKQNFQSVIDAFREAYFQSSELRWKNAADLFSQTQAPAETVVDFVSRIRKNAIRINLSDEMVHSLRHFEWVTSKPTNACFTAGSEQFGSNN